MVDRGMRGEMTISDAVRKIAGLTALILGIWVCGVAGPDAATAKSSIFSFSVGPSTTQAGAHPNIVSEASLGTRFNQGAPMPDCSCNDPKEVIIHGPPGVVANPHVVSECLPSEAAAIACPADAQAGFVIVHLSAGFGKYNLLPLFRTTPQAEQAARFVFGLPEAGFPIPQYLTVEARTGTDYGLDIKQEGIAHIFPPDYIASVFWGVPGLPAHDLLRFKPGEAQLLCSQNPIARVIVDELPEYCPMFPKNAIEAVPKPAPVPSSLPVLPFTQNPTTCAGPLDASMDTVAYDHETAHVETSWPETTGCDQLSFDPSLSANPTTTEADTAAGLDVKLSVPQYEDPNTPSPSEIRASTVTLPEGFSINPNAADGKTVCTDAEASFGSTSPSHCPETSKIGTDTLDSSALPGPIPGYIYLGEPKPGDRYRLILTAGGFGTFVKIAGSIHADPQTGQLVTSFENLPQSPFQEFDLHFFGSERGVLATPVKCGTYPVHSTFTPWSAAISDQTSTQFFTIDSGPRGTSCPGATRLFEPAFEAGTANNTAGVHSTFGAELRREDGEQNVTGLEVTTPPGFLATLKGIPYCPQSALDRLADPGYSGRAEQASSLCPPASQIGTAVASVGAGSRPLHIGGKVYLAGPYKGAPLSIAVVTPAVSGPYDLGNVVVRAAVHVDPITAQVRTASDPVPQILEGIPLRLRSVRVSLDRPDFALNPTNCDHLSVDAAILANEGETVRRSAAFQVANCTDLAFGPNLGLKLSGGLRRRGHPAIHAVVTAGPGEANLKKVSVTLPKGELLDNAHIRTICTRIDFAADRCPAGSAIGRASVTSPLLDDPLEGTVYLRSSPNKLPDIVMDLKGQIDFEVAGRVDSVDGRLRAIFDGLPDAPIDTVVLDLEGGSKGLLINSESLCGVSKRATVKMVGQNGRTTRGTTKLQARCRSGARAKRRHHTRKSVG
jgi:hypothetical protein